MPWQQNHTIHITAAGIWRKSAFSWVVVGTTAGNLEAFQVRKASVLGNRWEHNPKFGSLSSAAYNNMESV